MTGHRPLARSRSFYADVTYVLFLAYLCSENNFMKTFQVDDPLEVIDRSLVLVLSMLTEPTFCFSHIHAWKIGLC